MNELLNLVTKARVDANAGNLTPERMIELLAMMEDYLQAENAAKLNGALSVMSFSELRAMAAIAHALDDNGMVVAYQAVESVGLTRSLGVSAMRKMESAGVFEARSLGMKGMLIKTKVQGWQEAVIKLAAA